MEALARNAARRASARSACVTSAGGRTLAQPHVAAAAAAAHPSAAVCFSSPSPLHDSRSCADRQGLPLAAHTMPPRAAAHQQSQAADKRTGSPVPGQLLSVRTVAYILAEVRQGPYRPGFW